MLILLIHQPIDSSSGEVEFSFRNINVEEGLHHSIVYSILQDKDGALWFALRDGADRFNGYNFTHHSLQSIENSNVSKNPQVRSFIMDETKNIWAGSENGLFRYDYMDDFFHPVITGLKEKYGIDQITVVRISAPGHIWIGTNTGILVYGTDSDSVYHFPEFTSNILSLFPDKESCMWIGTDDGLYLYDYNLNEFIDQTNDPAVNARLLSLPVFSYFSLDDQHLLIGTRNHGLMLIDRKQGSLSEVKIPGLENFGSVIRDIVLYKDEYLMLGVDGRGLLQLDRSLQYINQFHLDEDIPNSLSNDGIYDLLIDSEDRLWISTYGGGVDVYDPNLKAFQVVRHEQNNSNSLKNNMARSAVADSRGRLWLGTRGGISILDREKDNFIHIESGTGNVNDLGSGIVLSLIRDRKNRIWAGTFSGGIDIYNEDGKKLQNFRYNPENNNSLATDYVYVLHEDLTGNIWAGGIRGGLTKYDPNTGQFQRFDDLINVHCIRSDSENRIIVGTLNGLYYRSANQESFQVFKGFDKDSVAFNNRVFCIYPDKKGRLWIGTEGEGISQVNLETGKQINYSVRDGLPSNIVYGIVEDEKGVLWLSTTNGISQFIPEDLIFQNYTSADGISGKEFNYGAYYKAPDGTIVFGGTDGFTLFQPSQILINNKIPALIFTNFYIFNQKLKEVNREQGPWNINETDKISLKYDQNSFTIEFAALNYTSTAKNQYSWKLEGLDQFEDTWTFSSIQRTASFTGLPPGEYIFRVQASNNDNVWNYQGRSLAITIEPPLWNTLWARIIYAIFIVSLLVVIQRYIFLILKERHSFEKIRFFINIAHDIRTPLTLIKGPVEDLLSRSPKDSEERKRLELVAGNTDRLNNLINQLLDFQKADLKKFVLKVSEQPVYDILSYTIKNFEPIACKDNIGLKLAGDKSIHGWCDRPKLERIIYNLLSNAIKYSFPGTEVIVSLSLEKNILKIEVADQGRGIPRDQQKQIFNRYFRSENIINSKIAGSGVGLMLTKKLVELHKGKITFSSQENLGTTFTIVLPVARENYQENEIFVPPSVQDSKYPVPDEGPVSDREASRPLILVVEDNEELKDYLISNLMEYYRTASASNGKEGIEITNKINPDLIISDIMMPEMDGIEYCSRIRQSLNTSHIPIILLTALNTLQNKIQGLEYGADDYIEKPFDFSYLKARIDNLLKSRRLLQKKYINKPDKEVLDEIRNQPDKEMMEKAIQAVMENFSDCEFSVEILCRQIGVSRPVLYRKLKAYTGQSPQDFIKIFRLKKAEELLLGSPKSVKEIAYEVGFSDPRYFSVSFKKYFGKSPREFVDS